MDEATIAFCILINQRQRNKAIGITTDPQFLRGMAGYVLRTSDKQAQDNIDQWSKAVRTVYLKALIEQYQILANRLTDYILANIEDADIRNEGVYTMTKIESYITHLGDELEGLWQPL